MQIRMHLIYLSIFKTFLLFLFVQIIRLTCLLGNSTSSLLIPFNMIPCKVTWQLFFFFCTMTIYSYHTFSVLDLEAVISLRNLTFFSKQPKNLLLWYVCDVYMCMVYVHVCIWGMHTRGVCVCVQVQVSQCAYRGQRTTVRNQLSPTFLRQDLSCHECGPGQRAPGF